MGQELTVDRAAVAQQVADALRGMANGRVSDSEIEALKTQLASWPEVATGLVDFLDAAIVQIAAMMDGKEPRFAGWGWGGAGQGVGSMRGAYLTPDVDGLIRNTKWWMTSMSSSCKVGTLSFFDGDTCIGSFVYDLQTVMPRMPDASGEGSWK